MSTATRKSDSPLASAYLEDVRTRLASWPSRERDDLLRDLRDHIDASGDEDLGKVLARLGDSADIARQLSRPFTAPALDRDHVRAVVRIAAVISALGSPMAWLFVDRDFVAVWLVGVIALWLTPPWRYREYVIATLFGPVLVTTVQLLRVKRWLTAFDCRPTIGCSHLAPWPVYILGYVIVGTFLFVGIWIAIRILRGSIYSLRQIN